METSHRKIFREEIRNAIREVIRDTEAMGLVETVPFKGFPHLLPVRKGYTRQLRCPYLPGIKSIRDVIMMLTGDQMEQQSVSLQDILKEMDDCAKRGNLLAFTECGTAFHRAIIDATGNQVFLKLWEQYNMRNWLTVPALTNVESLLQLQSGHQHICPAICAKDVKEAASTLEDHLTGLMDGFIRGIQP